MSFSNSPSPLPDLQNKWVNEQRRLEKEVERSSQEGQSHNQRQATALGGGDGSGGSGGGSEDERGSSGGGGGRSIEFVATAAAIASA